MAVDQHMNDMTKQSTLELQLRLDRLRDGITNRDPSPIDTRSEEVFLQELIKRRRDDARPESTKKIPASGLAPLAAGISDEVLEARRRRSKGLKKKRK